MTDIDSLLKTHEDVVVYRIPDPSNRTHAYTEVGLFPWELNSASFEEIHQANIEDRDIEPTTEDGIGLRVKFSPPTKHHPRSPSDIKDIVQDAFDVKSHGFGPNGKTFRIQNTEPGELREAARHIIHYAFCYWWLLDETDAFVPGLKRDETRHERRERLDLIADARPDGTIIRNDGTTIQSPYTLDSYTFKHADEWETPTETATQAFNDLITDLTNQYPKGAVRQAYHNADLRPTSLETTKTDAKEQADAFKDAILEATQDADGIGYAKRNYILKEFDSLDDLCSDLRNGGKRLKDHSHISESTEDTLIDALVETENWVAHDGAREGE